ncbi:MAG TPA: tyrosine-type recombinase/integrase [Polyangiaceae bacterium]
MAALVEEYLAHRRSMGFALRIEAGQLRGFARHADEVGHRGPLTVDLIARWATVAGRRPRRCPGRRLDCVRPFARYRAAIDSANEIPPAGLLGFRRRPVLHVYTESEIHALVAAARRFALGTSLRSSTYATLFGLLAACGLRISEALRLVRQDVDLDQAVITIRATKFRKTRLVPLHATTVTAMRAYALRRDCIVRCPSASTFFVTDHGAPLRYGTVGRIFGQLRTQLGWATMDPRPRIHDLRHAFACRRLQQWYVEGADVAARLASLATYLGHAHITDTYWYLTGTPELLGIAAERFERFAGYDGGAR